MHTLLSSTHLAWFLSAAFGVAALLHLVPVGFVRRAYARWRYPAGFAAVTGALLALASVFLLVPETRIWGGLIAGIVMFLSAITLLNHRQYAVAVPLIALFFALVPASLSGAV